MKSLKINNSTVSTEEKRQGVKQDSYFSKPNKYLETSKTSHEKTAHLTNFVSACRLYPEGEDDPLLAPPTGGPGIPGTLGTEFTGRAS